jgi:hypothetical protein
VCDWNSEGSQTAGVQEEVNGEVQSSDGTDDASPDDSDAGLESDNENLDALGARADAKDLEAEKILLAKAKELGKEEEVGNATNWAEAATILKEAIEAGGSEPEAPALVPGKDEVFKYKPEGAKKLVEVMVKKVNKPKKTCGLLNLDDRKTTYDDVPWSALIAD